MISVEQFTAPGKFYIDLAMYALNKNFETPQKKYIGIEKGFIECGKKGVFKNNPYFLYHVLNHNTYNDNYPK